jgi:hypothetical protein
MIVDVKARKGRVAFTAARGGVRIPNDRFISVAKSDWLVSLAEKHGDIEMKRPEKKQKAPAQSTFDAVAKDQLEKKGEK